MDFCSSKLISVYASCLLHVIYHITKSLTKPVNFFKASKTSSGMKTHLEYMDVVGFTFSQNQWFNFTVVCIATIVACVFSSFINCLYWYDKQKTKKKPCLLCSSYELREFHEWTLTFTLKFYKSTNYSTTIVIFCRHLCLHNSPTS